ncbi:MAG TPA: flagellar hook-basal body complex protein FliE [Alphaproteobacteria bacterium]
MPVTLANVSAAYKSIAKVAASPGMDARSGGGDFASMVKDAAQSSVNALKQGEAATMLGVAGKLELTNVVTAVNNAQLTLQTAVAVRDRIVQSYQQIMQMPI